MIKGLKHLPPKDRLEKCGFLMFLLTDIGFVFSGVRSTQVTEDANKEKGQLVGGAGEYRGPKEEHAETTAENPVHCKEDGTRVPLVASQSHRTVPEGWEKMIKQRQTGKTAGKFDICFIR